MFDSPELTPREIIRHGYRIGAPVKAIAELCGSTPGSVRVIAHNMGLRHASRIPPDKRDEYFFFRNRKRLSVAFVRELLGMEGAAQV